MSDGDSVEIVVPDDAPRLKEAMPKVLGLEAAHARGGEGHWCLVCALGKLKPDVWTVEQEGERDGRA